MPADLTWISALLDISTVILISMGCFFFLAGTVGLLRFPDLYCRLHALTNADTLGLGFITAGLLLQISEWSTGVQLLIIWALALGAAATVCHLLARSSLRAGIEPVRASSSRTGRGSE
jgi:multicomponent Na+:H+ antiporter subunit G